MATPDASVVIPVHNGELYIRQAVDSALAQVGVDVEVIVVDDASTDATAEVLAGYAERVRVVRLPKQPSGIAATNEGIKLARGEFVCVLHHDDVLAPTKLARHVELMRSDEHIALSYSAQHYIDADGRRLGGLRSPLEHRSYVVAGTTELRALAIQNYINFCNAVVRRKAYDEVGLYPADTQITGEWAMWIRLAKRFSVGYIDEPLASYRLHRGQLTLRRGTADYLDQLMSVHRETFDGSAVAQALEPRRHLALANVHLNLALVHWLRGERRESARELRVVIRLVRPWELRDFVVSSALLPRTLCRLRLRRDENQAAPANSELKSGSPGPSVSEHVLDAPDAQFHGK